MIGTLLFFALLPLHVSPAQPTVGDLVTIRPDNPQQRISGVTKSDEYEVVSSAPSRIVIRSFAPGTHSLLFNVTEANGSTSLQRLDFQIVSVLPKNAPPKPAPLLPPLAPERNPAARIALISAAAMAVLAWGALILLARRRRDVVTRVPLVDPDVEFEQALAKIDRMSGRAAASALADAVRRHAARTEARLSADLTTTEFLRTLETGSAETEKTALIRTILLSGDMAKFAPWQFNGEVVPTSVARTLLVRRDGEEAA